MSKFANCAGTGDYCPRCDREILNDLLWIKRRWCPYCGLWVKPKIDPTPSVTPTVQDRDLVDVQAGGEIASDVPDVPSETRPAPCPVCGHDPAAQPSPAEQEAAAEAFDDMPRGWGR
jgi:hypothetical protein